MKEKKPTIRDFTKLIVEANNYPFLNSREFNLRIVRLNDQIHEEAGNSELEIRHELGEESQRMFEEMKKWIKEQVDQVPKTASQ